MLSFVVFFLDCKELATRLGASRGTCFVAARTHLAHKGSAVCMTNHATGLPWQPIRTHPPTHNSPARPIPPHPTPPHPCHTGVVVTLFLAMAAVQFVITEHQPASSYIMPTQVRAPDSRQPKKA